MKFSLLCFALPLLGDLAVAAPTAAYQLEEPYANNQSPSASGIAQADLEKRTGTCRSIAKAIWSGKKLTVAFISTTLASKTVKGICERHDNKQCAIWVDDFKDVFDLCFAVTGVVAGGVANLPENNPILNLNPAGAPATPDVKRSVKQNDMVTQTANAIKQHGWSFDSIEDLPISSNQNQARDGSESPSLIAHHIIKNLKNQNGTRARDHELYHFADGTSHTFIPRAESANDGASGVTKRHDGAGVKVVFYRTGIAVTKDEYSGASAAIASGWDEHAEAGESNLYGFTEKLMSNGGKKAVLYFRTIIETKGFGDNYERLDDCGKMGGYIGQYLGPA